MNSISMPGQFGWDSFKNRLIQKRNTGENQQTVFSDVGFKENPAAYFDNLIAFSAVSILHADQDGDRALSRDEFMSATSSSYKEEAWQIQDLNQDGKLSMREMSKFLFYFDSMGANTARYANAMMKEQETLLKAEGRFKPEDGPAFQASYDHANEVAEVYAKQDSTLDGRFSIFDSTAMRNAISESKESPELQAELRGKIALSATSAGLDTYYVEFNEKSKLAANGSPEGANDASLFASGFNGPQAPTQNIFTQATAMLASSRPMLEQDSARYFDTLFSNAVADMQRYDLNQDFGISRSELEAVKGRAMGEGEWAVHDTNGDDQVDLKEWAHYLFYADSMMHQMHGNISHVNNTLISNLERSGKLTPEISMELNETTRASETLKNDARIRGSFLDNHITAGEQDLIDGMLQQASNDPRMINRLKTEFKMAGERHNLSGHYRQFLVREAAKHQEASSISGVHAASGNFGADASTLGPNGGGLQGILLNLQTAINQLSIQLNTLMQALGARF